HKSIDEPISEHVEAGDGLFHRAWQLARTGPAAGLQLDRPAGSDAGELPRLCRCVLDADADFARRRPARAAQSEARRTGTGRPLRLTTPERRVVMKYRILAWATISWIAVCLGPYIYALNDLITWR